MHLVTIDIVILGLIAILIIGIHIGLLISTYIFAKPIEKSKAKKPTPTRTNGIELYTGFYICPNCNGILSQQYDYCHKCGQALDWGILNE